MRIIATVLGTALVAWMIYSLAVVAAWAIFIALAIQVCKIAFFLWLLYWAFRFAILLLPGTAIGSLAWVNAYCERRQRGRTNWVTHVAIAILGVSALVWGGHVWSRPTPDKAVLLALKPSLFFTDKVELSNVSDYDFEFVDGVLTLKYSNTEAQLPINRGTWRRGETVSVTVPAGLRGLRKSTFEGKYLLARSSNEEKRDGLINTLW
jgi:hypothetical protein